MLITVLITIAVAYFVATRRSLSRSSATKRAAIIFIGVFPVLGLIVGIAGEDFAWLVNNGMGDVALTSILGGTLLQAAINSILVGVYWLAHGFFAGRRALGAQVA